MAIIDQIADCLISAFVFFHNQTAIVSLIDSPIDENNWSVIKNRSSMNTRQAADAVLPKEYHPLIDETALSNIVFLFLAMSGVTQYQHIPQWIEIAFCSFNDFRKEKIRNVRNNHTDRF